MQRERIIRHIQDAYGIEAEYLWADTPDCAVFRHPGSKKWFGIMMNVRSNRLGLDGEEPIDIVNVKCGPILTGSLLTETGFFPAYHMNKSNWITILLNNTVPDGQITQLLELSYDSIAPKRKSRKQLSKWKRRCGNSCKRAQKTREEKL